MISIVIIIGIIKFIRFPETPYEQRSILSLTENIIAIDKKTVVFGSLNVARVDMSSAFVNVLGTVEQQLVGNGLFAHRLFQLIAFAALVMIFNRTLVLLKISHPVWLTAGFATNASILFYSTHFTHQIWIALFGLAGFYFGLKIFINKQQEFYWPMLGLAIIFLALPLVYNFGIVIAGVLDLVFLYAILITKENRVSKLGSIALINILLLAPFASWTDVASLYWNKISTIPAPNWFELFSAISQQAIGLPTIFSLAVIISAVILAITKRSATISLALVMLLALSAMTIIPIFRLPIAVSFLVFTPLVWLIVAQAIDNYWTVKKIPVGAALVILFILINLINILSISTNWPGPVNNQIVNDQIYHM